MSAVIAIRHEPLRYHGWRAWRTMKTDPSRVRVETFRACCPHCAGRGVRIERIPRRNPDYGRMAYEDTYRPPWLLPVICATCDGSRYVEQRYAVLA